MEHQKAYVIASQRRWNADLARRLAARTGMAFTFVADAAGLSEANLAGIDPRYVFVCHWSTRIPDEVWQRRECVIFHMTDVPYGRGGSPLQNLIASGHADTVISALRCEREVDAGPVYLKRPLPLHGSAEEIFLRADRIIEEMILEIVRSEPEPLAQEGEVVTFKRRRPEDGRLDGVADLRGWYDLIRMLDAEGYPRAFLDVGGVRLEFSRVSQRVDGLVADVTIRMRTKEGDR